MIRQPKKAHHRKRRAMPPGTCHDALERHPSDPTPYEIFKACCEIRRMHRKSKRLSQRERRKVLQCLSERRQATVNELSGLLGMDRNALQHHLETLETMGRVEHRSHNSYRIIDQEPNEKILARFKEGARCYA